MAEQRSDVYAEEYYRIAIGQGIYTSELATNIPDGYSASCYNMIATGDSLENRSGIRKPSVDWITWGDVRPAPTPNAALLDTFVEIAPWGGDSTKPAFMWASAGYTTQGGATLVGPTLNAVRAAGTTDANNGFMSTSVPNSCYGICQYNGTVYFLLSAGVQKISAFNWATDAITYSAVASGTITSLKGLITFKNRLWAWKENNLYYTNIPTVGGLPETWSSVTNFVPFVGPDGACDILKVVPIGNRLVVFTTAGLFTLLVEGEPASWILRILDSKSISTSYPCAFETKGVVYYVNTEGVWATNGLKCTNLSGVISDQFFRSTGSRLHTICYYEDGMIVSVLKTSTSGTNLDNSNCKVFYSKLDPICWTDWDVGDVNKADTAFSLVGFYSTTNKIPTYLNSDPVVYGMMLTTDSTAAVPKRSARQLVVFDGGHDEYQMASFVFNEPVQIYLKTKHFDGGNQYNMKYAKRAMLELYTSDSEHEIYTSWDLDATISVATEARLRLTHDFTVGLGSNLVQIKADFHYRRASFNLKAVLQTDTSQIKIKDLALAQDLGRSEFELIR